MTVTEYEREFVRLSKYAREYASTEEIMCKRTVDGLNEDIKLLVKILEFKEFVVLVDRTFKAKELSKEKRKADSEARDSRQRSTSKPYHSSSKKSRDYFNRSTTLAGYSTRDHGKQYTSPKAQATSVSSVGNVKNNKPECQQCETRHFGDCWVKYNNRACYRSVTSSRGATRDSAAISEARAYAISARKEVSPLDVITGTFSLYDTNVIALIGPGSTYSYICMNLVFSKNFLVESTEFMIKVSNPLGKYVLVDKVCKNYHLMTRGYYFPGDLMLLPFDEFDVILGMDWLTLYDVVVNCRRKIIELKC
ncbi:Gag-Pol polyprotein [Gossypium australe]|uniref:Gag-Pol polyprotein n=1 Tax=Gossypium australe TaxID=47621 RepID=A0A5B6WG23_9ROSI|nr:Gag-Pol polyprotein [Gossypium australe]